MEASKQWMKEGGFSNRISFNDGSSHTVKLVKDKVDSIGDGKGGQVNGMKYLVEENGEQKTIFTGSIGLVSKLAVCSEGDLVTIQMKKANNKSFYVVTKEGQKVGDDGEVADDEVPAENPEW